MRVLVHAVVPLAMLLAAACGAPSASPESATLHELVLGLPDEPTLRDAVVEIVDARLRDAGLGRALADPADPARLTCRLTSLTPAQVHQARRLVVGPGTLAFRICATDEETASEDLIRAHAADDYVPTDVRYVWVRSDRSGPDDVLVLAEERLHQVPASEAGANAARERLLGAALDSSVFTQDDLEEIRAESQGGRLARDPPRHVVFFKMRVDRRAAFKVFTAANVGRSLAVVVDGRALVTPVVRAPLPGEGIIDGGLAGFTRSQAESLAATLRSRPLPTRVEIVEERAR